MARAREEWWRGAVIYQIYPRSFQDANGDGIGDLPGITQRLAYVAALGVDAIWISPFFPSPMKDFGYDVSDYHGVDPMFGTLADFDALVAEAHRLGLKVMIDQVISHTSDQHPWFAESRASRDNPRGDWYVWAEPQPDGTPPNNWLSVFGGQAWEWEARRGQYYLHNFLASQPDLNFHNRQVQDALLETLRFWLERGVDGFRFDTLNFYFHSAGLESNPPLPPEGRTPLTPASNPYNWQDHLFDKSRPENLAFLERIRALTDGYDARTTLGEVGDNQRGAELMGLYTAGETRMHMCYSFDLLTPERLSGPLLRRVVEGFEAAAADGWPCWAFSNHDVARHATRWGGVENGADFAKMTGALLLSLRGSVCLYQGEELGLPEADVAFEDLQDPYGIRFWPDYKGRDGARTPMAWDADAPHGGFSAVRPWLPAFAGHGRLAVSAQETAETSTLSFYRAFLALRREHPALRGGTMRILHAEPASFAFAREAAGETVLCAFNLGPEPANIRLPDAAGCRTLAHGGPQGGLDEGSPDGGGLVALEPFGIWLGARERQEARNPAA
jgi:alpha-glucosidase